MKIVVCIKQVPDTTEIKIDQKTGTLQREGVPSIMNPEDKHALLAAVKLSKDVTVISMGPPQAEMILREALAYGASRAILLSDFAFAGSDTAATSYALAQAIKKINPDLIMCGRQAIDGDTAQVGPQIAELLDIPQVTYVKKIVNHSDEKITVEKETKYGSDIVESNLPVLLTCLSDISEHYYPTLQGINLAFDAKFETWNAADIDADKSKLGLKGSPTWVLKSFAPQRQRQSNLLKGQPKELARQLAKDLKKKVLLKNEN